MGSRSTIIQSGYQIRIVFPTYFRNGSIAQCPSEFIQASTLHMLHTIQCSSFSACQLTIHPRVYCSSSHIEASPKFRCRSSPERRSTRELRNISLSPPLTSIHTQYRLQWRHVSLASARRPSRSRARAASRIRPFCTMILLWGLRTDYGHVLDGTRH